MELSADSIFQRELLKDEKIYWSEQPDASVIFSPADWYMVPFSLMWGGFAIFWEATVLGLNPFLNTGKNHAPFFFALWGIPFVLVGIYMIVGRFFYKVWRRKRTYYAITNKRILQVLITGNPQVYGLYLNQTASINKFVRSNGSGTLVFGYAGYFPLWRFSDTGMGFFTSRSYVYGYSNPIFAFFDIPDIERVYDLIKQLQNQNG